MEEYELDPEIAFLSLTQTRIGKVLRRTIDDDVSYYTDRNGYGRFAFELVSDSKLGIPPGYKPLDPVYCPFSSEIIPEFIVRKDNPKLFIVLDNLGSLPLKEFQLCQFLGKGKNLYYVNPTDNHVRIGNKENLEFLSKIDPGLMEIKSALDKTIHTFSPSFTKKSE